MTTDDAHVWPAAADVTDAELDDLADAWAPGVADVEPYLTGAVASPAMSDDPTTPDPLEPDAPADPDADPDDTDADG